MTIFLLLIAGLAMWGIVASILVVSRDGYRRQPVRQLAETWQATAAAPDARPSDLAVGQWLPERATPASGARMTRTAPAAGAMVLRPW